VLFIAGDGLYPGNALPTDTRRTVKLDGFLSARVGFYDGEVCTVRDTIKQCANVLGGVHLSSEDEFANAGTEQKGRLRLLIAGIRLAGIRPIVLQLRSLCSPQESSFAHNVYGLNEGYFKSCRAQLSAGISLFP
jgi:hypothetical protein